MCYPNFTPFEKFPYSWFFHFIYFAFSLEFGSHHKKHNSPLLLLLNRCKLSYFIGYKRIDLKECATWKNEGKEWVVRWFKLSLITMLKLLIKEAGASCHLSCSHASVASPSSSSPTSWSWSSPATGEAPGAGDPCDVEVDFKVADSASRSSNSLPEHRVNSPLGLCRSFRMLPSALVRNLLESLSFWRSIVPADDAHIRPPSHPSRLPGFSSRWCPGTLDKSWRRRRSNGEITPAMLFDCEFCAFPGFWWDTREKPG